jgi:hypothetical protein
VSILLLLLLLLVAGAGADMTSSPAAVHLIRRAGRLPQGWYEDQAALWRHQLARQPDDPRGWYSLYLALEYGGATRASRAAVLETMTTAVPDSYELAYLRARHETDPEVSQRRLEEALSRCPDCGEVLEELALQREMAGDVAGATRLWRRLYDTAALPSGLLDYNYNLLQSVADGGVLVTAGDNDTFPAWLLQRVVGVRRDVLVINLFLADAHRDDLTRRLRVHGVRIDADALPRQDQPAFLAALCDAVAHASPDTPIHVALTVGAGLRQPIAHRLRLTGLAARLDDGTDPRPLLVENLERRFRLDSLWHDWYAEAHPATRPIVRRLNGNYAYAMLLLADRLEGDGDQATAELWRRRALQVAETSGDRHLVDRVRSRSRTP